MTATAADRTKASRVRKLGTAATSAQRTWLASYEKSRGAPGRPPAQRPAATPQRPAATPRASAPQRDPDAPSRGYVAPPAIVAADTHTLTDLRELDAIETPENAAASSASATPSDGATSHAATSDGGCGGLCPTCRKATPAPTCAVSGDVIPRPLDAQAALVLARTTMATIRAAITLAYQAAPDAASESQCVTGASALEEISKRYDLQMVADWAPFLLGLQAFGGYAAGGIAQGKARKAEKIRAKKHALPAPHAVRNVT